jgi:PAS domain S-box-containing protein
MDDRQIGELLKSKKLLDETGMLALVGGWEVNIETGELYWTEMVYRIYEVGPEFKPTMENAINFYEPEAMPVLAEAVRRAAMYGESFDLELPLVTARQKRIWVRAIGRANRVGAEIVSVIGMFQDITRSRMADEALKASEERFRAIFDCTFQFTGLITPDGTVIEINQSALDYAGIGAVDVFNRPFWETGWWRGDEARVKKLRDSIARAASGEFVRYEVELQGAGGKTGIFDFSIKPVFDQDGGVRLLIPEARDISNFRQAETERRQLEAQLQQAMKMEAVGRLAGGVAHDFNNLLTGIICNTDLALLDMAPDNPLAVPLGVVSKAAESAAVLTRQLMAFSRKQVIEPRVVNLNTIINNLHSMLKRLISENIDLKTIPGRGLGFVYVDPGQFEQIIVNLVVNARDAMPQGGRLVIETAEVTLDEEYCKTHNGARPGRFVMLAVSDTGQGMGGEVRGHLFEPFFTTKPKGQGTGLGLATTYGVVRQASGSIEVYSEEGKGSTFKIYLPLFLGKQAATVVDKPRVSMPKGKETIMVVEDEKMVRDFSVLMLKRLGYQVLEAPDGERALLVAKEYGGRIDLLFTDVIMPGINGQQLSGQFKEIHPETDVLYTSGYTENAIVNRGVLDEKLNFIGKPYTPHALAGKIRELLDNRR